MPLRTWSLSLCSTGFDSPVRADSSNTAEPPMTTPSTGTISPGLTMRKSPGLTSSIGAVVTVSPSSLFTVRGVRPIRADSSFRALDSAYSSSTWPPESMSAITAPARYSPRTRDPAIAISAITSTPSLPE